MGKRVNACGILMGKSERKRPLGIYRPTLQDDIKMAF